VWTEFKVKQDESNILVGDWVYCVNRTDYKTKHPLGNAGGWNLICVSTGPRKYLGFGLAAIGPDIKRNDLSGPLTLEEVLKVLDLCYLMDPQKLSLETKRELASYDLPRPKGVTIEKACLDVSVPGKRLNAAHIKSLFQEKMLNYTKGKIDDHLTLPSLEK
jgi:hypothetical protein